MRKTTGLILLLSGVISGCASKERNFAPAQEGPIVEERTLIEAKITPANFWLYKNSEKLCKLFGMKDEEYDEIYGLFEKNIGKTTRCVYVSTFYPEDETKDEITIRAITGEHVAEYTDARADGYVLDGKDETIDRVRFYPEGMQNQFVEFTGESNPEFNARAIELIKKYEREIISSLEK